MRTIGSVPPSDAPAAIATPSSSRAHMTVLMRPSASIAWTVLYRTESGRWTAKLTPPSTSASTMRPTPVGPPSVRCSPPATLFLAYPTHLPSPATHDRRRPSGPAGTLYRAVPGAVCDRVPRVRAELHAAADHPAPGAPPWRRHGGRGYRPRSVQHP